MSLDAMLRDIHNGDFAGLLQKAELQQCILSRIYAGFGAWLFPMQQRGCLIMVVPDSA
jgi:hypothetical protein